MKKIYNSISIFLLLITTVFINQSCSKEGPFAGVDAILSSTKIDHLVQLQITDANPAATTPYPANAIVTLEGAAVTQGLIYTSAGELITTASGSAKVINNAVSFAVKPYTVISKSQPLKFFIKAEAPNYISNYKEVTITSIDSIQYLNLSLLKIASLPVGVANTATTATAVAGSIATDFVVNVKTIVAGTTTPENTVSATFPAQTVFIDASSKPISTPGNLNITVTSFSAADQQSVAALPGGISANTIANEPTTFILAGAVDINATIGGTTVKTFSNPIPFEIKLASGVFNTTTNSALKVGDQVPVWSRDSGSVLWKNEGLSTVESDGSGKLKTTIQVSHLSTWMVAFNEPNCSNSTIINYVSNSDIEVPVFLEAKLVGGSNQILSTKTATIKNGDKIELKLPTDVAVTITAYAGSSATGTAFSTISLAACAATGTITNTVVSTNPILSFDLQTRCSNGIFRYSGPIDYKVAGAKIWIPYTPAVEGKLTTNLLEWDKTYDFRIIYREEVYVRSRAVVQSEFRLNGTIWEYFGKTTEKQTFFNSPTSCN